MEPLAHCKVLDAIRSKPLNTSFEGKVYKPGSVLPVELLGKYPVVIECAGRTGSYRTKHPTTYLWILWSWNWSRSEWSELARASAVNWEWSETLKEPAIAALNPNPQLYDALQRGQDLADQIMREIEQKLGIERQEIQVSVLTAVYDRVAGKIAECS